MQIIHRIDDFLFTIFPALAKDHSLIVPTLEDYFTYGPFKPKITIEDDIETIQYPKLCSTIPKIKTIL